MPCELAKILVEGHENASLALGPSEDFLIGRSGRVGTHPGNIVTASAQRCDSVTRKVLVRQEAHELTST